MRITPVAAKRIALLVAAFYQAAVLIAGRDAVEHLLGGWNLFGRLTALNFITLPWCLLYIGAAGDPTTWGGVLAQVLLCGGINSALIYWILKNGLQWWGEARSRYVD